jgi:hypothetical protein
MTRDGTDELEEETCRLEDGHNKTHEYQRISAKARQLRAKGLSWSEIRRQLKVTGKTAKKAAITRNI